MTLKLSIIFSTLALLAMVGYTLVLPQVVSSNGFIGSAAYIQTATTTTVGPQSVVTLFEATTDNPCKSRIVTTNEDAILISFGDVTGFGSTTLAAGVGHYQAGSTTVAYESGIYGCGLMTALGETASGTVTLTSF